MTVAEVIEELKKYPPDAECNRQIRADQGTIEIEQIRYDAYRNTVTID